MIVALNYAARNFETAIVIRALSFQRNQWSGRLDFRTSQPALPKFPASRLAAEHGDIGERK